MSLISLRPPPIQVDAADFVWKKWFVDLFRGLTSLPDTTGINILANGDFSIWQRGTSFAVGGSGATRTADRWDATRLSATGNFTVSRQTSGGPTGFPTFLRMQRTATDTNTNLLAICQNLETVDSKYLAGQAVILSAWVRSGANFSGSNVRLVLQSGTGTDQNACVSYSGLAFTEGDLKISTTWTRYSWVYTLPSNATELAIFIAYNPTGTAGVNDYMDVAGVQLELGTVVTDFQHLPFATQLLRCQRYFQKSFPYATAPAQNASGLGALAYTCMRAGANAFTIMERFGVRLRTTPTITYYNPAAANAKWRNTGLGADSGAAATTQATETTLAVANPQVAGDSLGNIILVHWTADAEL